MSSDNILFFDTETTGLPNFKARSNDPSQPSVLQLGCILASPEGEEIMSYQTLIKIGNKPIHPMALAAHHIPAEKANSEGIEKHEAFQKFYDFSVLAESLCCHNFNFDIRLMRILAAQAGDPWPSAAEEIMEMPYYCTMKSTISYCALPFPSGRKGNKFPKLEELYHILFQEKFEGAHDALVDVRATMRCFFKLREMGIM